MNFFQSIVSFFEVLYNFFLNMLQGVSNFLEVLYLSLNIPTLFSGALISIVFTSGVIFVAITVVRKIFGR